MINQLKQQFTDHSPYSDAQVLWLLDHLGHPDPTVRDDLVFASIAQALNQGRLRPDQARYLFDESVARQLLTTGLEQVGPETLTRSFTCLLYWLLVSHSLTPDDPYQNLLTPQDYQLLLTQLTASLPLEKDTRGHDPELGWVHALAHGADALAALTQWPQLSRGQGLQILRCLVAIFRAQTSRLTAGEPARLAEVLVSLASCPAVSADDLMTCWQDLTISGQSPSDFACQLNIQDFLAACYFRLQQENLLTPTLRDSLLSHPHLIVY